MAFPAKVPADSPEEVTLLLASGARLTHWTELSIMQKLDSFDTFSLTTPPDALQPSELAEIEGLKYKQVALYIGGVLNNTATVINGARSSGDKKLLTVSGYALPGVLNDCMAAPGTKPIEWYDVTLRQITDQIISPFGLLVQYDASVGAVFEQEGLESTRKILPFLITLASARGLVIGNTPDGKLRYFTSEQTVPVAAISPNSTRHVVAKRADNGQDYFSSVTGVTAAIGAVFAAERYTINNPFVTGVFRPFVFKVDDAEGADLQTAVKVKFAKMLGKAMAIETTENSWLDDVLNPWLTGNTVLFHDPGLGLNTAQPYIIDRVELTRDEDGNKAKLNLALPSTYSAEIPKSVPWQ